MGTVRASTYILVLTITALTISLAVFGGFVGTLLQVMGIY
jgi:hypothetical protein